jgi:hypothetical protein
VLLGDAILVKAVFGLVLIAALAAAWRIFDPARAALVSLLAATALIDVGARTRRCGRCGRTSGSTSKRCSWS